MLGRNPKRRLGHAAQEMGADLGAWERGERKGGAGAADQPRSCPDLADPRRIVSALTAVRNRPPPKDPTTIGYTVAMIAGRLRLLKF